MRLPLGASDINFQRSLTIPALCFLAVTCADTGATIIAMAGVISRERMNIPSSFGLFRAFRLATTAAVAELPGSLQADLFGQKPADNESSSYYL